MNRLRWLLWKKGYGIVDRRLYLPDAWFSDEYKDKWKQCDIPEETKFQTKNEIASEMINNIVSNGIFQVKWIGCDAAFGCDHKFLKSIPKDVYYFASVRENELIFPSMPQMNIPENEAGKNGRRYKHARPSIAPISVKSFAKDDSIPWVKTVLAEGTKGLIIADVKCIRCVSCASTTKYGNYVAPGEEIWLYIRKYADGTIKYFISNAPSNIDTAVLNKVSTMLSRM